MPQRDFLKRELKHVGQGPCTQLPCQKRDKIESEICSHSIQLGRETRKLHSKMNTGPQLSTASKLRVTQNRELGTVYCEGSGLGIRGPRVQHL